MRPSILSSLSALAIAIWSVVGEVAAAASGESTISRIRQNGRLRCGVNGSVTGFSRKDDSGTMRGLDADMCRAIAAAIGPKVKVHFVSLDVNERFTALESGQVDLLARNTTWNVTRDSKLGFEFAGIYFFDGQQFLVKRDSGLKSVLDLNDKAICVQSGTTTATNLADYFRRNRLSFKPIVFTNADEAMNAYRDGRCDALTNDGAMLAAARSELPDPTNHVILPEVISKEPISLVVAQGDAQWSDLCRWTLNLLVFAEEKGIKSANVQAARKSIDPEVQRVFGDKNSTGADLGVDKAWANRVIRRVGNYGEMFARHIGAKSSLKLERGFNDLWLRGGLLYALPYN